MIKVGDLVITNDLINKGNSWTYSLSPQGSLVIAHKKNLNHYLLFNPNICLSPNIQYYQGNANYDIDWIDEIKAINPDYGLLWYYGDCLIKLITVNMPDGTTRFLPINPVLEDYVSIDAKSYIIEEISEDESNIWVEVVQEIVQKEP